MLNPSARLFVMMGLTTLFMFAEIVTSYLSRSLAMRADAFHMLSDILSLATAIGAIHYAKRPPSSDFNYGWSRAEHVGALVNSLFLLALCVSMFLECLNRVFEQNKLEKPMLIVIVGTGGLLINIFGMYIFHQSGHSHSHGHGHGGHSHSHSHSHSSSDSQPLCENEHEREGGGSKANIRAVFLHVMGDALNSVVVIVGGLLAWQFDNFEAIWMVDPILTLFCLGAILYFTIPVVRDMVKVLMQAAPPDLSISQLEGQIAESTGNVGVQELRVWQLSDSALVGTVDLVLPPACVCDELSSCEPSCVCQVGRLTQAARDVLLAAGVKHSTVQVRFEEETPKSTPREESPRRSGSATPSIPGTPRPENLPLPNSPAVTPRV